MTRDEILSQRKNKFLSIGRSKGFRSSIDLDDNLVMKENLLQKIIFYTSQFKFQLLITSIIVLLLAFYLI